MTMSRRRWLGWLMSRPVHRRPRPSVETLEDRIVPVVQPLTLADPSLYGVGGLGASTQPSISADGQLIAFVSSADNLVPNDTNGQPDAFVYNRSTGAVTLVSVGVDGMAAGIDPQSTVVIGPNGQSVVFESNSSDVLGNYTNYNQ